METREQRGKVIAETAQIKKNGQTRWLVPSQSSTSRYFVDLANADEPVCSCPDFEERRMPCKHIYAVAYFVVQQTNPDGSTTVTETVTVTKRKTYPQNWPAYNAAQTSEQDRFQELLRDLCSGIQEPVTQRRGRPSLPLRDAVFASAFKVYSCFSGRRFMSDLRESHMRGMISRVPCYNSIFNYLEDEGLTPVLLELIRQSSLPLASVEVDFAVDSSGFGTSRYIRWYDHKYGKMMQKAQWIKAHVMCGVKTNIITAIEIDDVHSGDSPMLPKLVNATAKAFTISEVSADAAYGGAKNVAAITAHNATPFMAFKRNTTGKASALYEQMFHYFMYKREEYLQHYHKRSNVESTFSMMKRKFGDSLRSKTDTALVNEALCKVLCHNLVVLIHEMCELNIETTFWKN
ncbi:MAG TPA: transposase [Candidatus Angelobacter sp.]|jgi:transposase